MTAATCTLADKVEKREGGTCTFSRAAVVGPFANFDSGGLLARLTMYTNDDAICYAAGTIPRHREVRDDALRNRAKNMPKYASSVSAGGGCRKKKKKRLGGFDIARRQFAAALGSDDVRFSHRSR